ncbi:MAG: ABC transporter ATP-binding protein [Planctomycetota bacterium]|jgi:putative ABC transport system ATP-binding protein
MSEDVLLSIEGLTWTAPGAESPLFDALDLGIAAGEVFSPTGPSGCGKTSLLRAMALLLEGASGTLRWRGETVSSDEVPEHRRRVTLVAQDPAPVRGTVRDDLAFARELAGENGLDESGQTKGLADLGLGDLTHDTPLVSLSGGERRRVALVRALSVGPQVLLLDEPTTGLDPDHAAAMVDLLQRWKDGATGRSLVWVTHDAEQRDHVATRVVELGNSAE